MKYSQCYLCQKYLSTFNHFKNKLACIVVHKHTNGKSIYIVLNSFGGFDDFLEVFLLKLDFLKTMIFDLTLCPVIKFSEITLQALL